MNPHTHRTTWMFWGVAVCLATSAWAQTSQPESADAVKPERGDANTGIVKGSNVYIRSGFSTNYYPVTKLNQGEQVKIAGEEFGWLKIVPPAGTYSLIEKTYVDRVGDKKGMANGGTWVYAGSTMDERRYAKQVKLNKGDEVQVIGETSDGAFFKIEPPAGAHLWVKADFIDCGGIARAESPNAPTLEPVKPGQLKLTEEAATPLASVNERAKVEAPKRSAKQFTPAENEKFQLEINAIEAEIAAESARPLGERVFGPIITKLQPIADQTEDEVSQIYAKTRIEQLQGHSELVAAVSEIRTLHDSAIDVADVEAKRRAQTRVQAPLPLDDVVVRGEIRLSGIYDGAANRPKRWRIVDPQNGRTLSYVEVPEGSPIDPVQYFGKRIGVRASAHRQLKNTIPPVPIYTIKELVILDPGQTSGPGSGTSASPAFVPLIEAGPSTQPAESTPPSEPEAK